MHPWGWSDGSPPAGWGSGSWHAGGVTTFAPEQETPPWSQPRSAGAFCAVTDVVEWSWSCAPLLGDGYWHEVVPAGSGGGWYVCWQCGWQCLRTYLATTARWARGRCRLPRLVCPSRALRGRRQAEPSAPRRLPGRPAGLVRQGLTDGVAEHIREQRGDGRRRPRTTAGLPGPDRLRHQGARRCCRDDLPPPIQRTRICTSGGGPVDTPVRHRAPPASLSAPPSPGRLLVCLPQALHIGRIPADAALLFACHRPPPASPSRPIPNTDIAERGAQIGRTAVSGQADPPSRVDSYLSVRWTVPFQANTS